jgi:hypothetical protein
MKLSGASAERKITAEKPVARQKPLDRPTHASFVLYNDYALFVC